MFACSDGCTHLHVWRGRTFVYMRDLVRSAVSEGDDIMRERYQRPKADIEAKGKQKAEATGRYGHSLRKPRSKTRNTGLRAGVGNARSPSPVQAKPDSAATSQVQRRKGMERPGLNSLIDAAVRPDLFPLPALQRPDQGGVRSRPNSPADAFGRATSGTASPLPHRATMESSFATDLSDVEAHVGTKEAQSGLASLDAEAATQGRTAAFASPSPSVETVAHEVTHLVQASASASANGQLSSPDDKAEREADSVAAVVAAGGSAHVQTTTPAGRIHRSKRGRKIGGIVGGILGGIGGAAIGLFTGGIAGAIVGGVLGATAGGLLGAGIGEVVSGADYSPEEEALAHELAERDGHPDDWRNYREQAKIQLGTLAQAEQLEGDLDWEGQGVTLQNTEFGRWLLNNGPEPDPNAGQMNCWEMVMFSAYRGGFTTRGKLSALYRQFAADLSADIGAGITNFENALRSGQESVYDRNDPDSPRPLAGDIVIFQNLGAHVAIAIGEDPNTGEIEIMNLWTQNSRQTFRTTVENLLDNEGASEPVRFFSPNW